MKLIRIAIFALLTLVLHACASARHALPESLAEVAANEFALDEAVGVLRSHSLLKVDKDAWSVHRLVQETTRDRLGALWSPPCYAHRTEVIWPGWR